MLNRKMSITNYTSHLKRGKQQQNLIYEYAKD